MKFSEIKHKIKNLGNFKSLKEIKKAGLRIVRNTKTGDYWLIEKEFLKPVIKSPRECKSILIKPEDLKYKVLMVHKSKKELKGKKVLDYIKWGEKQTTRGWQGKQPAGIKLKEIKSVKGRKFWYSIEEKAPAPIIFWKIVGERFGVFYNKYLFYSDQTFYLIYPFNEKLIETILIFLNSIVGRLIFELGGIEQTGAYTVTEITVENTRKLFCYSESFRSKIKDIKTYSIFTELGFDSSKPIREQEPNPLPDRKALDDIVFDALGLTEEERKEVYWAVAELVKNRLEKARSV
mgnify:CR=1 FL=1